MDNVEHVSINRLVGAKARTLAQFVVEQGVLDVDALLKKFGDTSVSDKKGFAYEFVVSLVDLVVEALKKDPAQEEVISRLALGLTVFQDRQFSTAVRIFKTELEKEFADWTDKVQDGENESRELKHDVKIKMAQIIARHENCSAEQIHLLVDVMANLDLFAEKSILETEEAE